VILVLLCLFLSNIWLPITAQDNQPPTINEVLPQMVEVEQSLTVTISYSDPDGDTLTVTPVSDNPAVATVILTAPQELTVAGVSVGAATITVSVDDGRGGTASTTFPVTVSLPPPNQPPIIDPIEPQTVEVGQSLTVTISYSDPDGDTLTVIASSDNLAVASVAQTAPQELTVAGVSPGMADITIRVDDGRGGTASTTFPVTVSLPPPPPPPNQPPIIDPIEPQTVEVGQSLTVTISYSDPDGDPVTVIASSDNADVATVALPAAHQLTVMGVTAGTVNITVTISDDKGGTNSTSFSVTVIDSTTFIFAAGGDIGANSRSDASLRAIPPTGAAFFLALGDMDYDETTSDEAWCDYVKQRVGSTFPFEIVTGNHEEGSANNPGPDGYIGNHAACLPDYLGAQPLIPGAPGYPANYYFDYPQGNPLMRVIMLSADLAYDGVVYNFNTSEQTNYSALAARIDEARQAGLWVVVGVHKVCLTMGTKPCEIGADLQNLLIEKQVDLVLHGHDHNYQRSKQIALGASCARVEPEQYNPACVVDEGSDNLYVGGAGTVLVINGNVGRCCYTIQVNDSEAGYFAQAVGVDGINTNGFVVYTVSASRIDAQVVNTVGVWNDAFSIVRGGS
jgi:uncharacterized protein YjdB